MVPKSSLSIDNIYIVDSFLKTFKFFTRHIQNTLSELSHELQILNRIHYKGNNQHGSSLHWKRVVEVRRYALRLQRKHDVSGDFVQLHNSFFRREDQKKLATESWSVVPMPTVLGTFLETQSSALELLNKMLDRIENAEQHLQLVLQTGSFLHLIVIIVSSLARMHAIVKELCGTVEDTISLLNGHLSALKEFSLRVDSASNALSPLRSEEVRRPYGDDGNKARQSSSSLRTDQRLPDVSPAEIPPPTAFLIAQQDTSRSKHVKSRRVNIKAKQRDVIDDIFGM